MKQGKLIVFEGLDGTGKTTQIKRLARYLEENGEKVFVTAEPTDFPSGKLIRRVLSGEVPSTPWSTAALFLADRIRHCADPENGIAKHLAAGETVITDRYYFSTFAYQGCETDLRWAMEMHYGCPQLPRPDLVLFLTMSPEKCMARITAGRPAEAIEIYENTAALTQISAQFDKVFDLLRDRENVVYIDACGTRDEVAARILAAVQGCIKKENRMARMNLILFDFDGTVVDNSEGIFNCIRYSLEKLGMPVPEEAVLRRFVGPSLFDSYRAYCEDDQEKAERFVALYRERYAPVGFSECRLYDGMRELLSRLKADGYRVAVCSGKPYDFVKKIIHMLQLDDLFDGCFCPGFAPVNSDKAGLILAAAEHFGVTKEQTLMVGDRRFDIEAAKKAGVASLGVRYGFAEPGELEAAGADRIVATVEEIYPVIRGEAEA